MTLSQVKIRNESGMLCPSEIEVNGVPVKGVIGLELTMGIDEVNKNRLLITQIVTPDIEIVADVDTTKVCMCCRHPLNDPKS